MGSIRRRLFVILISATTVIWLCAIGWIYLNTAQQFHQVMDTRLIEAARMVASLVSTSAAAPSGSLADKPADLSDSTGDVAGYEHQLSCQVWSFDGHLVGKSSGAPISALSNVASGFSDQVVNGEGWHVYSVLDTKRGIRVLVGDRLGLRNRLAATMVGGLLLPALLILPAIALLIWTTVGRGLRPFRDLAINLEARSADDLRPIDLADAPDEVRPVGSALNRLFGRVEESRGRERDFTAFAAHELRTPLAGLRTQVQVALAATTSAVRDKALRQILVSVDRTGRLVHQLLALSRLEASPARRALDWQDLKQVVAEVIVQCEPRAGSRVSIASEALRSYEIQMDIDLLRTAVRNLHENALHHSPDGSDVTWSAARQGDLLVVAVEDEGPGIREDERMLVTQRFYRGRHKSIVGTGLGLAIVEVALAQAGASLNLADRLEGPGLRAEIRIPLDTVRSTAPRGRPDVIEQREGFRDIANAI